MKNNKFTLITNSSGFTLTELILVIMLIGIFASVGMTRTRDGIVSIRTQVAIDHITADIDLLRSMASKYRFFAGDFICFTGEFVFCFTPGEGEGWG